MVKKMQKMKFEKLKDKKGKVQAVEITFYGVWNCLFCEKQSTNLVFCSNECKQNHYEKKRRQLKNEKY